MKVFCLLDWFTSLTKLQLSLTQLKFGFKAARSNKSYSFFIIFSLFSAIYSFHDLRHVKGTGTFPLSFASCCWFTEVA